MDKYKRLFSNTLIFAVGTFGSKLLVFFLMPLYTHVLTDAEYGTSDLLQQSANLLVPPSTISACPVTYADISDAKNRAALAISSMHPEGSGWQRSQ